MNDAHVCNVCNQIIHYDMQDKNNQLYMVAFQSHNFIPLRANKNIFKHAKLLVNYADSWVLPLARRRAKTLRPAFVEFRFRKPCRRLRFKTLGWYVRLIFSIWVPQIGAGTGDMMMRIKTRWGKFNFLAWMFGSQLNEKTEDASRLLRANVKLIRISKRWHTVRTYHMKQINTNTRA